MAEFQIKSFDSRAGLAEFAMTVSAARTSDVISRIRPLIEEQGLGPDTPKAERCGVSPRRQVIKA